MDDGSCVLYLGGCTDPEALTYNFQAIEDDGSCVYNSCDGGYFAPNTFTPNNDGYHDTWQILGVSSQFQPLTKIKIFNRYGKLLKELSPISSGWDGTFNGKVLPNDDYWFSAKLQDGREFVNHFTLKR